MSVNVAEATAIFRAEKPYPEELSDALRERWEAFVETMMYEIESFSGEDNPWFEAQCFA